MDYHLMKVLLGIINCQECGKEVSTKAESSPHCGMRQIILNKDLTVRIYIRILCAYWKQE